MAQHVDAMVKETRLLMQQMGDVGEFDINHDFTQVITMNVAAHALIGQDFRQSFGEEFIRQFHLLAAGLDPILRPTCPCHASFDARRLGLGLGRC